MSTGSRFASHVIAVGTTVNVLLLGILAPATAEEHVHATGEAQVQAKGEATVNIA